MAAATPSRGAAVANTPSSWPAPRRAAPRSRAAPAPTPWAAATSATPGASAEATAATFGSGRSFSSFERLVGTSSDSLLGANASNSWNSTGTNAGTLSSAGGTLTFSGVSSLTGGTGDDTFKVGANGTLAGTLNG